MPDRLIIARRSTLDRFKAQNRPVDSRPESIEYTQRQRPIPASERLKHV